MVLFYFISGQLVSIDTFVQTYFVVFNIMPATIVPLTIVVKTRRM